MKSIKPGFYVTIFPQQLNVDDHILNLLRQKDIKAKIAALTCVHFEVTENAENLLHNSLAAWQSPQDTSLWLDDFGSGYAGINAIRGYHFDYVKIDKDFFWHLMRKESGRQLMDALVTFLSRNHHNVIIEGVESEAHKEWLQGMEWFAIQGHYWREVSIEQLVADDIANVKKPGIPGFLTSLNYKLIPTLPSW